MDRDLIIIFILTMHAGYQSFSSVLKKVETKVPKLYYCVENVQTSTHETSTFRQFDKRTYFVFKLVSQ